MGKWGKVGGKVEERGERGKVGKKWGKRRKGGEKRVEGV